MVLWVARRMFTPTVYRTVILRVIYVGYQGLHTSTAYQVAIANLAVRCSLEQRMKCAPTPHPPVAMSGSVLIARPKMVGVAPEYTQIKIDLYMFVFCFILFVFHALVYLHWHEANFDVLCNKL